MQSQHRIRPLISTTLALWSQETRPAHDLSGLAQAQMEGCGKLLYNVRMQDGIHYMPRCRIPIHGLANVLARYAFLPKSASQTCCAAALSWLPKSLAAPMSCQPAYLTDRDFVPILTSTSLTAVSTKSFYLSFVHSFRGRVLVAVFVPDFLYSL
ncbi:hypothetical protein F5Y04DRAFT_5310 [Hypomontagnella monticulosa]|nr:hypothetical protein F5Y04DRAFT_5310 [Hypomontagnella monticulosa]